MTDVVCLGELLIDFVPSTAGGRLEDVESFTRAPGGAPANVAVGIARLGGSSGFIGMVGDDPFGRLLTETLATDGVDVSGIRVCAEARTALAFVSLQKDGERDFMFYRHPSADMLMKPEDVDVELVGGSRALHVGSLSLIAEPCRSAHLHAVDLARKAGILISCDPNLRLPLWPDANAARDGMLLSLEGANLVKISNDEVAFLTGSDDLVAGARQLWRDTTRVMVVTRGRNGAIWLTADRQGEVGGFQVDAIDATGAGDSFMAAVLVEMLSAPSIAEAADDLDRICRVACAAGAITTTGRGAIPTLPTRDAVETFLKSNSA